MFVVNIISANQPEVEALKHVLTSHSFGVRCFNNLDCLDFPVPGTAACVLIELSEKVLETKNFYEKMKRLNHLVPIINIAEQQFLRKLPDYFFHQGLSFVDHPVNGIELLPRLEFFRRSYHSK
ncbi:hypothetical protein [Undibacterium sp. SXout20W]|uniref:hypothetical protein n=1 Tax=Undibacterium sp. SXout20W TaxID=3413051 RepID=UPI003BF3CCBE